MICAKAASALQLEQVLRTREAIRATVFHEGLSILERDCAVAYFASEEDGAQVLICSEIGSEGRNFQFASHLIMFDLPFNPDLLEQRIGRLDRIGQTQEIQVLVPYLENTAQALAQSIEEQDNDVNLVTFALNLFDIVGVNQEDRSDNLIILTPSDHMLVSDFPGLPQDGCTITFEREQALSREDALFVSWEHPLIRNGMDLILSGDTGSCAVSLLKNKALPVGTLLAELVYVVEAQAPKQLQLTRFLPSTPLRLLMYR